jgi:hypothetical protein
MRESAVFENAGRAVPTSLTRFSASFVVAALASVVLPFLITPLVIMASGERLAGMGIGVLLGITLGWCLFPVMAWRPFRAAHVLAVIAISAVAFAALVLLPQDWVTTPRDDYGIYAAMISFGLTALAAYGTLTWLRNLLLSRLNGAPLDVPQIATRAWRIIRGRDER